MRHVSTIARLFAAILVSVLLLTPHGSPAATISIWNGTSGSWSDATKWSTNPFFPNNGNGAADYDATIGAGTVNLNVDPTLASLSLNGGNLSGSGNLTVGTLTLNQGTISTTGTLSVGKSTLTVGTLGRNLTLSGSANTIQNLGIASGFTLTNPVGATLTGITGPGERESYGPGNFLNQGTFIKTGADRFYASMPMNNEGQVQVQQGNLRLNSTGTHTGSFAISAAGQLELSGTQTFQPSSTISGLGGIYILAGTTTIDGEMSGASIRIANGVLTGSGNLHPTSFFLDNGTVSRNLTLSGNGNTIQNVKIDTGFTLTNPVGSTLTATTGPGERETRGPGTLLNQGTFNKTGADRYYASLPMNNEGLVQVQQGNMRLNSTGNHTGTFSILAAGQLELAGEQLFQPTATISGAGGIQILSGTATLNSDVGGAYLRISGGTIAGNGNLHPTSFFLDGGTISRNVTLSGNANTIQNVRIDNGFTLTNPVGATLTATTGPGERETIGSGLLLNQGTFNKTGGARYYASVPMNNDGLVQVQQGNMRLNSAGTHTGTFAIASGAQLELAGTQTFQPSATIIGPGGVQVISGTTTINSNLSGDYLRISGGSLAGSGNLQPDHFNFDGGTLARDLSIGVSPLNTIASPTIASGFTLTNPALGQLSATAGTVNGPGSFVNFGNITKTGAGTETFATFTNMTSGAVNVQAGTLALSGIGTQEGTFTVSNGASLAFGGLATSESTLAAGARITGAGKVNVTQGILNVPTSPNNDYAGGTTVGAGGRVNLFGAGTGLSSAAATIQSGGVISMDNANNLLPAQALVQTGGTLAVRNEFIPQNQIAPASAGTFGIDRAGFSTPVDLAVLGNGSMSLGSSQTGSYTAFTLGPGAGDTYRLGGGGGTITLTRPNVLTGNRPVTIVGPGTVVLASPQNFTLGTTIQAGTLALGSSGALGVGPLTFTGGGIRADGGPITINNDVTWGGNATLAGNQPLTINGPTQLTGNRTLTVTNTATTTITQSITQAGAGRRLTKDGPGTLVLAGDNAFTGGLTVRGGTVVLGADQHYGGTTTVDLGSKLVVQGDLLGGGPVLVTGGGTLQGEGTILGSTTIGSGSTIAPGYSPGVFTLADGLALQNGSHFAWELAALSTANPALDWDQLVLTGGQLSILAGAVLDLSFIDSATAPNSSPFWLSAHRWNNIVRLDGTATNPTGFLDFQINNTPWSQFGAFDTLAAQTGQGVDLIWNPVPEPSSWILFCCGAAGMWLLRRNSKWRQAAS